MGLPLGRGGAEPAATGAGNWACFPEGHGVGKNPRLSSLAHTQMWVHRRLHTDLWHGHCEPRPPEAAASLSKHPPGSLGWAAQGQALCHAGLLLLLRAGKRWALPLDGKWSTLGPGAGAAAVRWLRGAIHRTLEVAWGVLPGASARPVDPSSSSSAPAPSWLALPALGCMCRAASHARVRAVSVHHRGCLPPPPLCLEGNGAQRRVAVCP